MNSGVGMNGTIGVIGFGRFGRLMARYLALDGKSGLGPGGRCAGASLRPAPNRPILPRRAERHRHPAGADVAGFRSADRGQTPSQNRKPGGRMSLVKEQPVRWMQGDARRGSTSSHPPHVRPGQRRDSLKGRKIVLCRVARER